MKRIFIKSLSLGILLTGVLSAGCSDDFDTSGNLTPSLSARYLGSVNSDLFIDDCNAFTYDMRVVSVGTPWQFKDFASWLSASPLSGDESATVTLSGEANFRAETRTSVFAFQSMSEDWEYSQPVTLTQVGSAPYIEVSQLPESFSGVKSQQIVNISANCDWQAETSVSWLTLTPDVASGTLTIEVEDNLDKQSRSANVSLSGIGQNVSASFSITQLPSAFDVDISTLECGQGTSQYELTVTSDVSWTSTCESWMQVSPSKGDAGVTKVKLEIAPNNSVSSRDGAVNFFTGSTQRLYVHVMQSGLYLETPSSLRFDASQSSRELKIESNTDWIITEKPSWITMSQESGKGEATVTVTAAENPTTSPRTGTIEVGLPGMLYKTIEVYQAEKKISFSESVLDFLSTGGVQTIDIKADLPWTSVCSDTWFVCTPASGNGNATVTVTAEPNNTDAYRTGYIEFAYGDKKKLIEINQPGRYLTVANEGFEFDSKGGTNLIYIESDDTWRVSVAGNPEWISLSQTSGSGKGKIEVTVGDNPSVNVRSASLIVDADYAQDVRILITQRPRYLRVSSQNVMFFSAGGTSQPVLVETDGSYQVTYQSDWFDVVESTSSFVVNARPNPENTVRRGKITLSLTDLKEGSLSLDLNVIQAPEGGTFLLDGFAEDVDWNPVGSEDFSVKLTGYSQDQSWNKNNGDGLTITISGYSDDKDWNLDNASEAGIILTPYGPDSNWGSSSSSDVNIIIRNYGGDNDWDGSKSNNAGVSVNQYAGDKNWN